MALRSAVLAVALAGPLAAAGAAEARDFLVRGVGAATAIAVDRDSVRAKGHFRTGWTYEFYRERHALTGGRTQIAGVLLLADCKTLKSRRLKVVHYLEGGQALSSAGPERAWTEPPRGSNTELALSAMCKGPDPVWARRKAETVFGLYRQVWR